MQEVDPKEYIVDFFKERGFVRKRCNVGGEYFWTLNEDLDTCQDAPCVEYWFDRIRSPEALSVREARRKFIEFFRRRGHEVINPRPVVARWREDLYLTIASIVVFQPHVTSGIVPPPANPLVISQPSIRLEDIDNVGLTIGRHLTSFEMAAHHAFNYPDKKVYWKDETVRYAFEFFTKELGIPEELIVFKESWWEGGGNAGPCFEVAVGGLELATLVFMQYKVINEGYEPLPLKIVDTGYGVERISWFTMKTPTAFHAIYGDLLNKFRSMIGVEAPEDKILWAAFRAAGRLDPESPESIKRYYERVAKVSELDVDEVKEILLREARLYSVLDHTKTIALMLADGIVPSNSGEGYLARLVIRRALRQLSLLSYEGRLSDLVKLQLEHWGEDFPQMKEFRDYILDAVDLEEKRFKDLLIKGRKEVRKLIRSKGFITLEDLILFYDSKGIPPEIVSEEARKYNIPVETPHNFYSLVAARHRAPTKIKKEVGEKVELPEDVKAWARSFPPTRRLFHEDPYLRRFKARVLGIKDNYLVLDSTAFYPKGGGQDFDTGIIIAGEKVYEVRAVYKVGDVIVHVLSTSAGISNGLEVMGEIDWFRRFRLMRNHTATHIVLGAAKRVLGQHVWQAGAEKTISKARLDITHHKPLTKDEIKKIEELANRVIDERRKIKIFTIDRNLAESKYGFSIYQGGVPMEPKLRIVEIEDWDAEACFGTHVSNTAEVGSIKVTKAERIQDGVVRLEFVTGTRVVEIASEMEDKLNLISEELGVSHGQELKRLRALKERLELAEDALKRYRRIWIRKLHESVAKVDGVDLLIFSPVERSKDIVQDILRVLTKENDNIVAVALIELDRGVQVEIALGAESAKKVKANEIVKRLMERAKGRGGGKGSRASVLLDELSVDDVKKLVEETVKEIVESR